MLFCSVSLVNMENNIVNTVSDGLDDLFNIFPSVDRPSRKYFRLKLPGRSSLISVNFNL